MIESLAYSYLAQSGQVLHGFLIKGTSNLDEKDFGNIPNLRHNVNVNDLKCQILLHIILNAQL